ncbi:MAG: PAS domain S-box protein [Cyclobacteriaceae bacterium]
MSNNAGSPERNKGRQISLSERKLQNIKSRVEGTESNNVKQIIEAMPIGICITSEEGIFEMVNAAYCQLYGYEPEELIGEHFVMVVPDEYKVMLSGLHDRFMGQEYELMDEWEVQDKHGNRKAILANAAYLKNEGGRPQKMTFVVDISNIKDTENRLKQTIQILNAKIDAQEAAESMMVHDLRNPVTSIISIAEMLRNRELPKEELRWIDKIKDLGEKTLRLMKTASDFTKMERGTYRLEISEFDLFKLFQDIMKEARPIIRSKEVEPLISYDAHTYTLKDDVKHPEIKMRADKLYIEQLLTNLLINAMEASPEGARVTIQVFKTNPVIITIHNQGAVPEEIRSQLFEKNITHGKKSGQGLGAYIARMIARQHHGDITFVSSEEEGTTFTVSIPLLEEDK